VPSNGAPFEHVVNMYILNEDIEVFHTSQGKMVVRIRSVDPE